MAFLVILLNFFLMYPLYDPLMNTYGDEMGRFAFILYGLIFTALIVTSLSFLKENVINSRE